MSGFFVFNNSAMENVIHNLRNELIRSISAIDAWFDQDKILLSQKINATETVAEFLFSLVMTSRNLLDAITQNNHRTVGAPMDVQFPQDTLGDAFIDTTGRINLSKTRAELREQLDRCLIYLEWLQHRQNRNRNDSTEDVQQLGGYQGIYLLLIHLKRYIGDLDQLANRIQRHQLP
jgi:hypothetical protein